MPVVRTAFRLGASQNLASTASSSVATTFGPTTYYVRLASSAAVNYRIGPPAAGPFTINAATWAAGFATFTTTAPHSFGVAATVTIAAVNPAGYNGTYTTAGGTTGSTIVVPLVSNPGAYVSGGTATGSVVLTAVATDTLLPANVVEYLSVSPGQQLAAIGTATVNITELS